MSAYAATAMKIEKNLTATNENLASAMPTATIGPVIFDSRARQLVPGWIGS